jgi:serine/threonine protein kinase
MRVFMNKLIVYLFCACLSIVSLSAHYDYSDSYSDTSTSSYNYDDSSSSGSWYGYTDNTKKEREEPTLGETVQSPTKSYTLVRELGAGAFGKVFEVTTTSGENFALKWYMPGGFSGWFGDHLADHNREFMLGQVLDHPHIIKSVESFADKEEDRPEFNYTVLELVPGKTLSSCSRGFLELPEAILAAKQFISGVRHAFHQEFFHLDLHGNNVMLNQDQEVKIIDLSSFFSFEEIKMHCEKSETSSGETYTKPVAFKKIEQFVKRHPALKALKG